MTITRTTQAAEEPKPPVIFWARAANYQIANFKPEVYEGGKMAQREEPIRFHEHILTTNDPKVVKFVRKSRQFGIAVHECETMADALNRSAQQRQRRGLRDVKTEDVSSTEIQG